MLVRDGGDDHITGAQLRLDARAGTAHQHQARLELGDEQRRRHRRVGLADAGDRDDHRLAVDVPLPVRNALQRITTGLRRNGGVGENNGQSIACAAVFRPGEIIELHLHEIGLAGK